MFYDALEIVENKKQDAGKICIRNLERRINKCNATHVRRRVGGATFQIPMPIRPIEKFLTLSNG